ncbi:hypothetical protein C7S14_7342 [Burkholderia cepacia]|nr:hypothetical protein C7S14_7342 [Burkholderia cepacia]
METGEHHVTDSAKLHRRPVPQPFHGRRIERRLMRRMRSG